MRKLLDVTSAIKLAMGTGLQKRDILKSDEKIVSIGISNYCDLYVVILTEPDTFRVNITFPGAGSIGNKVIDITEVQHEAS